MLRTPTGEWVQNQADIAQMIQTYFKSLYHASDSDIMVNNQR